MGTGVIGWLTVGWPANPPVPIGGAPSPMATQPPVPNGGAEVKRAPVSEPRAVFA